MMNLRGMGCDDRTRDHVKWRGLILAGVETSDLLPGT
jgi:hypothetical protein